MKKQKKTHKIELEKANGDIKYPKNVDFVEISMPHTQLDKVANKNWWSLEQRADPALRKHNVRRQEKLLGKVFKAASEVLTDMQYQIFVYRYVYQMPETEISEKLGRDQSYIPLVLKNCIRKIQKRLRVPQNLKGFSRDRIED